MTVKHKKWTMFLSFLVLFSSITLSPQRILASSTSSPQEPSFIDADPTVSVSGKVTWKPAVSEDSIAGYAVKLLDVNNQLLGVPMKIKHSCPITR